MEQLLIKTLTEIGLSLLSLAGAYAIFFIGKAKSKLDEATTKDIKDEAQRKLIQDAFDRITVLSKNVVAQTEQVSASALRQAVADGTVEKTELEVLGKQAVETVYGQLTEDSKALLTTELSDLKGYITTIVEAEVLNLKK